MKISILLLIFSATILEYSSAHDTNFLSYVHIDIKDNIIYFINKPEVPSHLVLVGFEDAKKTEVMNSLQVKNNEEECPFTNIITHPEQGLSTDPYYFTAICKEQVTNLEIKDTFFLQDITPIYIIQYQSQSLTFTGNPEIYIKVALANNELTAVEGNKVDKDTANLLTTQETMQEEPALSTPLSPWELFTTYFIHGLIHILGGLDHIFFILGFILLASNMGGLIKGVTGFTISHSVTLTLAAQSILTLSPLIVEPFIALSISIVGILAFLNIVRNWITRFSIIFIFGLFHGLGFAGSIEEVGFPKDGFIASLLGFNVGIETGQLLFVFTVFPLLHLVKKYSQNAHTLIVHISSIGICIAGLFWFFQRIFF